MGSTRIARRAGSQHASSAIGLAIGLAGALYASKWMRAFLYDVSTRDTATFTAVPLVLVAMALLACWLPARRAMRVDPMRALRDS